MENEKEEVRIITAIHSIVQIINDPLNVNEKSLARMNSLIEYVGSTNWLSIVKKYSMPPESILQLQLIIHGENADKHGLVEGKDYFQMN